MFSVYEDHNCTFAIRSRVLGCHPPQRAHFSEFRSLNPDLSDERYNSSLGIYREHSKFENLHLSWTGLEYMFFMLKHNGVCIPEEGFAALRLFPLGDWHTHGEYLYLSTNVDAEQYSIVADFDNMRKRVRRECIDIEISDEECIRLWENQ